MRKSEITGLHKMVLTQLKTMPTRLIRKKLVTLIEQKVPNAPQGLATALADHVLKRAGEAFVFDTDDKHNFAIEFTAADIETIETDIRTFVQTEVPAIVARFVEHAAKIILKSLKQDWPAQREWELQTRTEFCAHLEERWGPAFDILRAMYTVSHEIGAMAERRRRRSRAKRNLVLKDTIAHLHARACQVVAEILCLMENGFADGAMARWRTLHEITIVTTVIARFGEDLAIRYRAHEAIETKRAMDRYRASHAPLGLASPTKKEIAEVEHAYDAALALYGDRFGSEYGWAGHHLELPKPRFIDLEAAAGKLEMRAYYGMASYNVHASPKGITFRLGLIRETGQPTGLTGRSNIGFIDPAHHTAADLTLVTSLLLRPGNLDDTIQLNILVLLRNSLLAKLGLADRQIMKNHRALTKDLKRS
jgi:hypothetical protein